MRLYLDNCCFNRPFDSQDSFKVNLETRAKIHIQDAIRNGRYEMATSYMLEYENSQNPDAMKRESIKAFQERYNTVYVPIERRERLQGLIRSIMGFNIAYKDATHLACAIYAGCSYLLTTDIRFQRRYKGNAIIILNPLEFVQIVEEDEI